MSAAAEQDCMLFVVRWAFFHARLVRTSQADAAFVRIAIGLANLNAFLGLVVQVQPVETMPTCCTGGEPVRKHLLPATSVLRQCL
jgi:hypothetical protein